MKNSMSIIGLICNGGPCFYEDENTKKIACVDMIIDNELYQFQLTENECLKMAAYLNFIVSNEWVARIQESKEATTQSIGVL